MARRRFYVPRGCIHGETALLPPDQAHHLLKVLRLTSGDTVELFDGEGAGYAGVVDTSGGAVRVVSVRQLESSTGTEPSLVLGQALLKSDKFEWVLQKATELGVSEIVPLETRFCNVRLPEARVDARLERWRRIVCEAAKQCRRVTTPGIHLPASLPDFLHRFSHCPNTGFLFWERAPEPWNIEIKVRSSPVVCIGPEGGWHPEEAEAALRAGFQAFNLGKQILRAETAALAAITLVRFQMDDRR